MDIVAGISDLIKVFGWPGALLVLIGLGGWRVGSFLAKKLFNEEEDDQGRSIGYVPRIVNAHIDMVEAVKKTAEDNTQILRANEGTNREILVLVRQGHNEMMVMNKAITEIAKARMTQEKEDSGILKRGRGEGGTGPSGVGVL